MLLTNYTHEHTAPNLPFRCLDIHTVLGILELSCKYFQCYHFTLLPLKTLLPNFVIAGIWELAILAPTDPIPSVLPLSIMVPFCVESALSGVVFAALENTV